MDKSDGSIARVFEKTSYQLSAQKLEQCPPDEGFEVAFAGRSNAGKSSAINTLTRNGKLARTSKTPGRTQLFNFFTVEPTKRLVDLPGYGYAKVPDAVKLQWRKQIDRYLRQRNSLAGLILVMDSRHPLSEFDLLMLDWSSACTVPIHVLLTKSDKLKRTELRKQVMLVEKTLIKYEQPGTLQTFSSLKRSGVDQLARTLRNWLEIENADSDQQGKE